MNINDLEIYLITSPACASCGPYKEMLKSIKNLRFLEVDASSKPGRLFCGRWGISSVPTLMILNEGKFDTIVGYVPNIKLMKEKIKDVLQRAGCDTKIFD